MEALVLAAGMGRRLGQRTQNSPKGFVELEGQTLIERSLQCLLKQGIHKVWIGTGHLAEHYERLRIPNLEIQCIRNLRFAETGSLFTWLACESYLQDDFLLLESDLLYEERAIKSLLADPRENLILASAATKSGDEVYLQVNSDDTLHDLSKQANALDWVSGELVGISKMSLSTFRGLCHHLRESAVDIMMDYEHALAAYSRSVQPIAVLKVPDLIWCEIDHEQHLERAKAFILPYLKTIL